jgi:hypothetical protein
LFRVQNWSRMAQARWLQCTALALLTLILRLAGISGPYFADAFRHIRAIESGWLVIHPPGYFFFNLCGWLLSRLLHVSAADALQIMNIAFSVAGAVVFHLLVTRIHTASSPILLSLAYVCSPVVWFSGDVHSSYAAATFFAPLLLLVVEGERRFVWGCLVWALMTAFRAADGVFVLPWMVFHALRFNWKERLTGLAIAAPITAAWWLATASRYKAIFAVAHRSINVSPLLNSEGQVEGLAQGVLTGHPGVHALVNALHAASGMIMTWGLLLPAVGLGAVTRPRNARSPSLALFVAPGAAFFLLYYVSDAPYFAYAAAAGMLLAGQYLERWTIWRQQAALVIAIFASLSFMFAARTVPVNGSRVGAVADAYFLKYSVSALKKQQDPRLAALLGACHAPDVRGICK